MGVPPVILGIEANRVLPNPLMDSILAWQYPSVTNGATQSFHPFEEGAPAAEIIPRWLIRQGVNSLNTSRINANLPLAILALVHLLCGPCLGFFVFLDGPGTLDPIHEGLMFGQIGLLGVWGGLAMQGPSIRLVGVAIGLVYLAAQYCFSVNNWELLSLLFVFLPTVTVAGAMLLVRGFVAKLQRPATATISPPVEGLQFSIRQMMLFTLVVGCLLGIVRCLQPRHQDNPTLLFATILLCCVSIAVTAVWAMLGQAPPIRRVCAVSLLGLLLGCISYLTAKGGELWAWIATMMVAATVVLASLLIVRQCGFRLVRVHANR
jgi:hypothetical protein